MLEPVSKRVERGIESKYFNIHYRPGKESKNSKLDINCSSLLTYLALADTYRDSASFDKAKRQFNEVLAVCQTEEELENLNTFLKEAAQVGGYASQFYDEVSKQISISGKELAEQTLQTEKENKQKPVSRRTITGIESQYFGINYRPGVENKNAKLANHCSSLLTYLALADIYRDDSSFKKTEEKFYQALLFCQTDGEIRELDRFLREASKIGGYANQFYTEKSIFLNKNGKEKAEQYLGKQKEERERPVSRKTRDGIESAYFGVEYRPGKHTNNFILGVEASSLLTYLALADIYRDDSSFKKASDKFSQVFSSCTNEKEVEELGTFLKVVSGVGGYAYQFYEEHIGYIRLGMAGVEQAKENVENQITEKRNDEERIADFNRRYSNACEEFHRVATSSNLNDEEIATLLKEFNELQGELYDFNGKVAKEFISETDYELDSQISWLRNAYQTVEELNQTFNI